MAVSIMGVGFALVSTIVLSLAVIRFSPELVAVWVFGLSLGFVLQKSRLCFVAAFRDTILFRSTSVLRALVLSLAIATIGFAALQGMAAQMGCAPPSLSVKPVGLHTVAGGLLFGTGMVIAGACASGTLTRLGEGFVLQAGTLLGLIAGSLWGASHFRWWYDVFIRGAPCLTIADCLGLPLAVGVQLGALGIIYFLLFRAEGPSFSERSSIKIRFNLEWAREALRSIVEEPWPYWVGGALLGLLAVGITFVQGKPWSVTTAFSYWGAWMFKGVGGSPERWFYFGRHRILDVAWWHEPRTVINIATVWGALLASGLAMELRLRWFRSPWYLLSSVAGGVMMGYGARLSCGCNIGAFYNGIASLSLHGWVFGGSLVVGAFLGSRLLLMLVRP